jgi:midasin (ATPase involved in ribosome maturation)
MPKKKVIENKPTEEKVVATPKATVATFSFGGLNLEIKNQENGYVPDATPNIIMPKEQERAVALAVKNNLPILLQGEAGTGKTSIARYVAHKSQQGFTRINMHGYATPDELIGSKSVKDGATYYEYGVLTRAMIEGHITVLDEINATPPDCLFILHGLLDDDKRITLPTGDIVRPHKDFRFFATMNPDYEGTKSLNRALIDRFYYYPCNEHT